MLSFQDFFTLKERLVTTFNGMNSLPEKNEAEKGMNMTTLAEKR